MLGNDASGSVTNKLPIGGNVVPVIVVVLARNARPSIPGIDVIVIMERAPRWIDINNAMLAVSVAWLGAAKLPEPQKRSRVRPRESLRRWIANVDTRHNVHQVSGVVNSVIFLQSHARAILARLFSTVSRDTNGYVA